MNATAESPDVDDWNELINAIKDGKCILFVGPETVLKSPGVSYHEELVKSPDFQENKYFKYIPKDEMFLLWEKQNRNKLVNRFRNYCDQNAFYDETYKKIIAIPFTTIISVSRYPFLVQTFEKSNPNFQHQWFAKSFIRLKPEETPQPIETPTAENPLVYNLFGKLSLDDSLLLTHADLFDYLSELLKNEKSIPIELKNLVQSASEIIFLGFKFDRWYVQLLLRLFKLDDHNAEFQRISLSSGDEDDVLSICETDFKIKFIDDKLDSFVNTLYNKYIERGLKLRDFTAGPKAPQMADFTPLLETNHFDDALKKLRELETKYNLGDRVTGLTGSWNEIREKEINHTLRDDDLTIEKNSFRNQLMNAIQSDIDQIKQLPSN